MTPCWLHQALIKKFMKFCQSAGACRQMLPVAHAAAVCAFNRQTIVPYRHTCYVALFLCCHTIECWGFKAHRHLLPCLQLPAETVQLPLHVVNFAGCARGHVVVRGPSAHVRMSIQTPSICSPRHHELYAPVCSALSPRSSWPVRTWRKRTRQLRVINSNRRHYHCASCEGRLLPNAFLTLPVADANTRQHDGAAGIVTAQMAQAAASQQKDGIKVVVFTTAGCPHCKRAKSILQEEDIAYAEVDVSTDTKLRQELQGITGRETVPQARIFLIMHTVSQVSSCHDGLLQPEEQLLAMQIQPLMCVCVCLLCSDVCLTVQIFIGGMHVGGADDLESLREDGKLTDELEKQGGSDGLPKALALAAAGARKQVL